MPLSDTQCKAAKAKAAAYKLTDERGLVLFVSTAGGKLWRFNYRFEGKRKTLAFGAYPDIGLKEARDKRDNARKLLAAGVDPSESKKAAKAAKVAEETNSFEAVAREWYARFSPSWAPSHGDKIIRRLERDVFPWLGKRPIDTIAVPDILEVLRRIEGRGAVETAHRAQQNFNQVFRYAVASGRVKTNPAIDLKGALKIAKQTHHAAIIEPKDVAQLLRAIDGYQGSFVTKCALRLAPLVFVRPGELRAAEWAEINLDSAEWNIAATRMKMREAHLVPLSTQAVAILKDLHELTGNGRFVFPSARTDDRPMSDNAILAALRRMGYTKDEMTGHGFRAMARTILDEILNIRPDYIEHQLAHAVRDPNGRAYNRTAHRAERKKMMQKWADYLDCLKSGTELPPVTHEST